jgi:predicted nucleic acid-binding Zn ribbon protein
MFEPFTNYLGKAANRYGIAKEINAIKICQNFKQLVPEIFKEKETPERYIQAAYFKNSVLVVNVENSAWAQEVVMRKSEIIKEMNSKIGKEVIKNLRTKLL